jgi:arylsulfatase A-like enzyme
MTLLRRRALSISALATIAIACLPRCAVSVSHGQDAPRPNVLIAIADDWGYGHAGAYGCTWTSTPAFDRVAKEGLLFTHCFTSNPKCSPCRASLLTGRNSWQTGEACVHFSLFPKNWPVYPDLFEGAGYHVGFTGKGWGPGDFQAGGFERNPAGPAYSDIKAQPPHRGMGNVDYAANFKAFLAKRKEGRPFCFWYGAVEPHLPYEAGIGVREGKNPTDVELPPYYPKNDDIRREFLDYSVEVEHFDRHLGLMLTALEEAGELDNTLVLVTSDHGEPLPRAKGQIYERGYRIPLAVRWGKIPTRGRTIEDFVNVRDFAPTFLQVAGIAKPDTMTGRSFVDVFDSAASGWIDKSRSVMLVGKERHDLGRPDDAGYPVRAIRTEEWLYARNFYPDRWPVGNPETNYGNCDASVTKQILTTKFTDRYRLCFGKRPGEELYRLADDPWCVKNLAADPALAETKRGLRERMEQMLREEGDPRTLGDPSVFEKAPYVGNKDHSWAAWIQHRE